VTKTLCVETEDKTEAAGFEIKADTVASKIKAEAVYLQNEAKVQGSWPILFAVLFFLNH